MIFITKKLKKQKNGYILSYFFKKMLNFVSRFIETYSLYNN